MQRPPEHLPRLDPRIRVRDLKIDSAFTDISTALLLPSAISHTLKHNDVNYHFYRDYKKKLGVLGSGAFGEVRLAQNESTGEWVAIKRFVRKPDADEDGKSTILGPNTFQELFHDLTDLLDEMKKHANISTLTIGPLIRKIGDLKTELIFLRKKMPHSSDDMQAKQLKLQATLQELNEYLAAKCNNDNLLIYQYRQFQRIHEKIANEQYYLNAFENELRNLNNLGEYLFHLEREGESYIGLKLYEGFRLSHFLPPKRLIKTPRMHGLSHSAEGLEKVEEPSVILTRPQKFRIIAGLLDAVRAMHAGELRGGGAIPGSRDELSFIHRDLKPSNIIVDDQLCVHVVDKGLAIAVTPGEGIVSDRVVGTKAYMAPECTGKVYDGTHYSEKSDMYSVGKTLARFMDIAVVENDEHGMTKTILLDDVDYKKINGEIYKLIERMQSQNRDERPTAKDALKQFEDISRRVQNILGLDKFICYTIRLTDLNRLVRDHTLKPFAQRLAAEGACSVAFIRDTDAVRQSDIVRMMRKLRNEGVMQFVPEIFPSGNAEENIAQYYKNLFKTDVNVVRSSREIAKELRVITHPTTLPIFAPIPVPANLDRVRAAGHRKKNPQKVVQSNSDKK